MVLDDADVAKRVLATDSLVTLLRLPSRRGDTSPDADYARGGPEGASADRRAATVDGPSSRHLRGRASPIHARSPAPGARDRDSEEASHLSDEQNLEPPSGPQWRAREDAERWRPVLPPATSGYGTVPAVSTLRTMSRDKLCHVIVCLCLLRARVSDVSVCVCACVRACVRACAWRARLSEAVRLFMLVYSRVAVSSKCRRPLVTDCTACRTQDFAVSRSGYGKVMWPGVSDITGVDILEVVSIEKCDVELYERVPSTARPRRGEKLNRPAIVELDGIQPEEGEGAAEFEERLREYTEQTLHAEFRGYDAVRGVWKFRIMEPCIMEPC